MPKAITVTRIDAPATRRSSKSPQERRAEDAATKEAVTLPMQPPLRQSPIKRPVVLYVPDKVPAPRAANTKGTQGRRKMLMPAWTTRSTRRFPERALTEALSLLKPAADTTKLKGFSSFAAADIKDVCQLINQKYSNLEHEPPIVCDLKPDLLRTHADAAVNGEVINLPGRSKTIPQEVVDFWCGWITLDCDDQRSPPIGQCVWMLFQMCDAAKVHVPPDWLANGPPQKFWIAVGTAKSEGG